MGCIRFGPSVWLLLPIVRCAGDWAVAVSQQTRKTGGFAYGHDTARRAIWIHGGFAVPENVNLNDIWKLDIQALSWSEQATAHGSDIRRREHKLVYDLDRDVLWMHGGTTTHDINGLVDDGLWKLNLQDMVWSQLILDVQPPKRLAHGFVYDPDRQVLWIHGGSSSNSLVLDDLWKLELEAVPLEWSEQTFSIKPSGRHSSIMTYISGMQALFLYGGQSSSGDLDDCWFLDLQVMSWHEQVFPTPKPPPAGYRRAAYAPSHEVLWMVIGPFSTSLWKLNLQEMTWSQQGFAKEGYLFFDVVDQALLDYDGREDILWKLQVFTTSTTRTRTTMTTTTRTTTTRTWTESKWMLTARTFVWSTAGTLSVFALGMSLVLLGVIAGVVNFSRLLCNEDEDLLEKQARHQNGAGEGEHDTADRIGRAQPKPAVFGSGLSTPHADRPISSELLVCVDQAEDVSARPDASTRRPLFQVVLTSPKLLALKMILESTNLVSSMMYTVEAYQRATRMTFTVQCVDNNILMPADPTECLEVANFNTLPWCSADVLLGSLCEGDEAEADTCPLNRELDNCEDASGFAHDLYRRTGPQKCGLVDCNFLAGVLWVLSTSSIAFTVLWTISWHFRGMLRDFSAKLSWGLSCCSVLCIWIALLFVGFFGDDGTSVVTFACLLPIVVIIAWIAAAGLATFCKGPRRRSAALELPLFNVLVALWLQPEDVEDMQAERRGLDLGLRVVEDLPEILMGVADLAFFKFSWFALSSIIMSMAMFFFYVLAASFRLLNEAAEAVAKDTE